jgi:hypothetical protein
VTVTNVYISEKGGDDRLRAGHCAPLWELLRMTSEDFWAKYQERITGLFKQMPTFAGFLSQVRCRFNPFRDEREYQTKIKESLNYIPGM